MKGFDHRNLSAVLRPLGIYGNCIVLEYDLAVTQHVGVEASNDGKVVYAAPAMDYRRSTAI
jgi:hypothetical protein